MKTRADELAALAMTIKVLNDDDALELFKTTLPGEKLHDQRNAEWEEIVKTRADELVALAMTIKDLNDDDALELFKTTLPSAKAGEIDSLLMAKAVLSKSAEKRMFDSKLPSQKESTKSSMEGHLEAHNDDKTHSEKGHGGSPFG